jgi:hypothetical protein
MKKPPREIWRVGGGVVSYAYIVPVRVRGKEAYFAQVNSGVRLIRQDASLIWNQVRLGVGSVIEVADFDGDGSPEALLMIGQSGLALVEVATGAVRWTWSAPKGAFVGTHKIERIGKSARLYCFPQNSLTGLCIDLSARAKQPRILWERTYPNTYWQGFGPLIALGDMDNDGQKEIVLVGKPGYVAAIRTKDGGVLFDIHHEIKGYDGTGRPYGLLQVMDMDGDGFRDVAMLSCQVEEYVTVLKNESGKKFRPIWSRFIEHDLPDDFRELRPNVTSFSDINGDGKPELVIGLFNLTGDNRWHTVVLDPMKGLDAPLADLPDRYFWGCYDLDGDGRAEIITSTERARKPTLPAPIQVVEGRGFRDVAMLESASFAFIYAGIAEDRGFMGARQTPLHRTAPDKTQRLIIVRKDANLGEEQWFLHNGKSEFVPLKFSNASRMIWQSVGGSEPDKEDYALSPPRNVSPYNVSAPLVGMADGKRELVFARSDGQIMGGQPDWKRPGALQASWTVPGRMASLWIGANGERTVCAAQDNTITLLNAKSAPKTVTIRTPYPIYWHSYTRSGGALIPFGQETMRLFVGLQIGVHTMACALYGEQGERLWLTDQEGPYPRTAAVAELTGENNYTILVDNHGKHLFYDEKGQSRLIAHGWNNTIPGRADGGKYVVPIVGAFGPKGETRILMSSGLQALELLDAQGTRLAKRDFASAYEFEWCGSAVAQLRGNGKWDIGMTNQDGIFHCVDVDTCQTRWTLDLGTKANRPINAVSGDLDGDGRDNFLLALPNGELLALEERDGKGVILWKMEFDSGLREAILADVDGDGLAEVIVDCEDGSIRILKGGR